eukprot:m.37975 g.37975  ORF g.37975 m.37975 type:complete len:765 (+) comp9380_c0_seq1:342-2636(+)
MIHRKISTSMIGEPESQISLNDSVLVAAGGESGMTRKIQPVFEYDIYRSPIRESAAYDFLEKCESAKACELQNRFDEAERFYREALKINQVPGGMVAHAFSKIANLHMKTDKLTSALVYHQNHLAIAEDLNDEDMKMSALNNIGVTNYLLGNLSEARRNHERALAAAQSLRDLKGQMRAFANLGNTAGANGDFKTASLFHKEQLRLAEELGDVTCQARALFNLQNDFGSLQDYRQSSDFGKRKENIMRTLSDTFMLNGQDGNIKEAYNLGDRRSGVDVFSGWLIKLEGGNLEGPEKNDTTKKWCVLQQDTFAYFKNTKSNQEALRYIPMDDVVGVEAHTRDTDWPGYNHECVFKIVTTNRAYYFQCETFSERDDWIFRISKARTPNKYLSQRKNRRKVNRDWLEKLEDDQGFGGDPFKGTNAKERHNPTFSPGSGSQGSRLSSPIPLATPEFFESPGQDIMETSLLLAPEVEEEPVLVETSVKLYGTERVSPSDDIRAACERLKKNPRKLYEKQLLTLSFNPDGMLSKTVPKKESMESREKMYERESIVAAYAFESSFAVLMDDSSKALTSHRLFVFDAMSYSKAKTLCQQVTELTDYLKIQDDDDDEEYMEVTSEVATLTAASSFRREDSITSVAESLSIFSDGADSPRKQEVKPARPSQWLDLAGQEEFDSVVDAVKELQVDTGETTTDAVLVEDEGPAYEEMDILDIVYPDGIDAEESEIHAYEEADAGLDEAERNRLEREAHNAEMKRLLETQENDYITS